MFGRSSIEESLYAPESVLAEIPEAVVHRRVCDVHGIPLILRIMSESIENAH